MKSIEKRLTKLEGHAKKDPLTVFLRSFDYEKGDQYCMLEDIHNHHSIERYLGEDEEPFIERAEKELVAMAEQSGYKSWYAFQGHLGDKNKCRLAANA